MINNNIPIDNTDIGFKVSTIQDCFKDGEATIKSLMPNGIVPNSALQKQILNAMAQSRFKQNSQFQEVITSSLNPYTAKGVQLDNICAYLNLYRKPATSTYVTCVITGQPGTLIPAGTQFQNETLSNANNAVGIFYQITQDVILNVATTTIVLYCIDTGSIECPAESQWLILSNIPGVASISNPNSGSLGRPKETDFLLLQRLIDYEANQLRPGGIAAMKKACDESPYVENYCIIENVSQNELFIDESCTIPPNMFIMSVSMKDDFYSPSWENITRDIGGNNNGFPMYAPDKYLEINVKKEVHIPDLQFAKQIYKAIYIQPFPIYIYIRVTYHPYSNQPQNMLQLIQDAIYNSFYGFDTNTIKQNPYRCWIGNSIKSDRFITAIGYLNIQGIDQVLLESYDHIIVPPEEINPDKLILKPTVCQNPILKKEFISIKPI